MFVHVSEDGGAGVVRIQTPAQTITGTSADCLGATKAAVNSNDWYKVLCEPPREGTHTHTHTHEHTHMHICQKKNKKEDIDQECA